MRISDWSSDVCSSDLDGDREQHRLFRAPCAIYPCDDEDGGQRDQRRCGEQPARHLHAVAARDQFDGEPQQEAEIDESPADGGEAEREQFAAEGARPWRRCGAAPRRGLVRRDLMRSEEHPTELKSLMRNSY